MYRALALEPVSEVGLEPAQVIVSESESESESEPVGEVEPEAGTADSPDLVAELGVAHVDEAAPADDAGPEAEPEP